MNVTIKQVTNGYLITTDDGRTFVANKLSGSSYSYTGDTVTEVLKEVFEAPAVELKVAA